MDKTTLPKWAKKWAEETDDGFITVDPAKAYPLYLSKLGYEETTQSGLEVARKCFTRDLRLSLGEPFNLRILKDKNWKLSGFPPGPALNFRREYCRMHQIPPAGLEMELIAAKIKKEGI